MGEKRERADAESEAVGTQHKRLQRSAIPSGGAGGVARAAREKRPCPQGHASPHKRLRGCVLSPTVVHRKQREEGAWRSPQRLHKAGSLHSDGLPHALLPMVLDVDLPSTTRTASQGTNRHAEPQDLMRCFDKLSFNPTPSLRSNPVFGMAASHHRVGYPRPVQAPSGAAGGAGEGGQQGAQAAAAAGAAKTCAGPLEQSSIRFFMRSVGGAAPTSAPPSHSAPTAPSQQHQQQSSQTGPPDNSTTAAASRCLPGSAATHHMGHVGGVTHVTSQRQPAKCETQASTARGSLGSSTQRCGPPPQGPHVAPRHATPYTGMQPAAPASVTAAHRLTQLSYSNSLAHHYAHSTGSPGGGSPAAAGRVGGWGQLHGDGQGHHGAGACMGGSGAAVQGHSYGCDMLLER